MKKLIFVGLMLFASSCSKEDIKPCNCGTVANDGITTGCYWLEIRNDCSGNKKQFCVDRDIWMTAHIGTNFCLAGEPRW